MKEKMVLVDAIVFFGGSIILLLIVPDLWYVRILAACCALAAGMGFMYWRNAN